MLSSACTNEELQEKVNKQNGFPNGIIISIDESRGKIEKKISNKFEGITFNEQMPISNFSINIDIFFTRLEEASIKNIDEFNEAIKLIEDINRYIKLNKDLLLEGSKGTLAGIKITYNDLNQNFLKRIEMLGFFNNTQINNVYKKVKNEYTETYYLFVPPNATELPKDINPIKYIRRLKTDKTIYYNQEKFDELFNGFTEICNKLIFQSSDFNKMDNYQLNELIYCLEEAEKQITNTLNEDINKNRINDKVKNKMNKLYKYYLSGAIRSVKKIQIVKEIPEKINSFFEKINIYGDKKSVENTYKDNETFGEFLNTYRDFLRYLYLIETTINQIKKDDLEKLLKTITNLKVLLLRLKNIKSTDTQIHTKVTYNSKQAYDSLTRVSNSFNLALISQ